MGWDTIDEHCCFKGWDVKIISDLQIIHKEPLSEFGVINASFRNGQMLHSIRMGITVLNYFKKPYLINSIGI